MNEDLQALQFVSNVVELKADKKYLLVFKNIPFEVLERVSDMLHICGFDCFCIALYDGDDLKVIEAPVKQKEA